jgi:hypothetical protein
MTWKEKTDLKMACDCCLFYGIDIDCTIFRHKMAPYEKIAKKQIIFSNLASKSKERYWNFNRLSAIISSEESMGILSFHT